VGFLIKKRKHRKGQAAIEFLTTYGWAIIGVLVVIGALSYFGLLDTKRFVSERCDIGSQLQCSEIYVNDQGNCEIALRNNYPVDIQVEQIYVDQITFLRGPEELRAGNVSAFLGDIGLQTKNAKKSYEVIVTFRRDGPGAVRSYNVTGTAVAKVHDASLVPLPSFGICGDGIVTYPEQCDTAVARDCASFGLPGGNAVVQCISCNWNTAGCTGASICGNGVVEPGEQCDGGTTTCGYLGLAGGSTVVNCAGCYWNTGVCIGGPANVACNSTTECQISEVCVAGYCRTNCDSYNGALCSDQPGPAYNYTNYGICTRKNTTTTESICDTSVAANSISVLYDTCLGLEGAVCDNDSLSGGYLTNGICQSGSCVEPTNLYPDGHACVTGASCQNSYCVDINGVGPVCASDCSGPDAMMRNCSTTGDPYTFYGVCDKNTQNGMFECDTNIAALLGGELLGDCSGVPDDEKCASGSLAGGFVPDGACKADVCKALIVLGDIGDPCAAGTGCLSGLCVEGSCAANCSTTSKLCSDTATAYTNYGVCTENVAAPGTYLCDIDTAALWNGVGYSSCKTIPDGTGCDNDTLAGGYVANANCLADFCVAASALKQNGDPCTYGTECLSSLCIDKGAGNGICAPDCSKTNGMMCSSSAAAYTNYGICTNSTGTASDCDNDTAAKFDNSGVIIYLYNCLAGLPAHTACQAGSLAGGFVATGECQAITNKCI
jgi:hypothetical protein